MNNKKELAIKAKDKKSPIGADIDLASFKSEVKPSSSKNDVEELAVEERRLMENVGVNPDEEKTAGVYIQVDQSKVLYNALTGEAEILPIKEAIKKYEWLNNYYWSAVNVDFDKYTSAVELELHNGYFIRAKAGQKISEPIQACLMLKTGYIKQNIHNIVIVEEGAELHLVTGCVSPSTLEPALHLGITEFYVKKNAKLTFTMIHRWGKRTLVRPRSAAIVEDGGVFINNYVILSDVGDLQTYPTVYLKGENSKAELYSVIYGSGKSIYDVGGRIILEAEGAKGKVVSRTIGTEDSIIYARGQLIGRRSGCRAHLECNGLLLSERSRLIAIPELEAETIGVELSHEATIGKIEQEQLTYLMSRGLSEEEANALIVRGFMTINVPDLPPSLQKTVDEAIRLTKLSGF
ncbi:MAG: SufD family Fe-S cluster assembly protein [Candidatus Odinarchaeum yellowstonii]|uniref:SufD family Fe-S cluster assembly protein n=1 Tax=Odinarchaeota yellowstonii (strain LCB_4) TaxID=1841599 RepID=A0AAF0D2U0_ODILC|nr:MAG: SufD family Fe-S cluster assembly protein [Candidatus Odinarchaeum yellowstonii]